MPYAPKNPSDDGEEERENPEACRTAVFIDVSRSVAWVAAQIVVLRFPLVRRDGTHREHFVDFVPRKRHAAGKEDIGAGSHRYATAMNDLAVENGTVAAHVLEYVLTRVRDKDCVKNRVKRAKIVRFTLC